MAFTKHFKSLFKALLNDNRRVLHWEGALGRGEGPNGQAAPDPQKGVELWLYQRVLSIYVRPSFIFFWGHTHLQGCGGQTKIYRPHMRIRFRTLHCN